MSTDTHAAWRFRPGLVEFTMAVFVLMLLTMMQIVLVHEVLAPELSAEQMEVFQLAYELIGLILVVLLWSGLGMAVESVMPAVSTAFDRRYVHVARAVFWVGGAVGIVAFEVFNPATFDAIPEFGRVLAMFAVSIGVLFVSRAVPAFVYERASERVSGWFA